MHRLSKIKKTTLYLYSIILFVFCQVGHLFLNTTAVSALDIQQYPSTPTHSSIIKQYIEEYDSHPLEYISGRTSFFYFSDFTADYYLEKDTDGVSHLRVKETVTAEFPPYRQNKGLTRKIPYTNQNNTNRTLTRQTIDNIIITRNGEPEPVYSIEESEDEYAYIVATGTDDYVLGSQTYTFEYTFDKVIIDFTDFQELYWDTNGNDSYQPFESVTVNLHLDKETYSNTIHNRTSCYVGRYRSSDIDRCTITRDQDENTITFSANNLDSGEGLTFAVDFNPGIFTIPDPELNIIAILVIIGQCFFIFLAFRSAKKAYRANHDAIQAMANTFVKPEYQIDPNLTVAEAAAVWTESTKPTKIMAATITELAIRGKIKLVGTESKKKWKIITTDLVGISKHETAAIQLLIGKKLDVAELSNQTFETTSVTSLSSSYTTFVSNPSKLCTSRGLFREKIVSSSASTIIILFGIAAFVMAGSTPPYLTPSSSFFCLISLALIVISLIPAIVVERKISKVQRLTVDGVKKSKFYDGLKEYIKLAEKDRIAFLQSVQGADTSADGIVKLYEKLLPYAIIFDLEKSWIKALEVHYKEANLDPSWISTNTMSAFTLSSAFSSMSSAAATSFASSMITSGGSGSSSSSGGGGGGYSGGGGGGGGFGGR